MSDALRNFIIRHDKKIRRWLEIFLGAFSWGMIIFFLTGSFLFPIYIAYIVIFFDVFWLYKSISFSFTACISYLRIKASEKMDWLGEVKVFPDWKKVHHVIIIPQYKEPINILERTMKSLIDQDFPLKQIAVVMATEKREPEGAQKAKILQLKYGSKFAHFFVTFHQLTPQETVGKHSNENYAARWVKKELIDKQKMNLDYLTITSSDADHCFHPKHFSYLAYNFLDNPHRYLRFWQPAVFFYNNYWRLPAITRVVNTISTIWQGAVLTRKDRMVSCQNYSLSFKLLVETGYWDPKVIPEDFHLFFRAYFKKHGQVEAEPIFLPVYADAAEAIGTWKTIKSTYLQSQRWAWGISDDPNVIISYLITPTISFANKTIRLFKLMEDHVLMPVNWFLITIGINIPVLLVPEFSRTVIGYNLPRVSSLILNLCILFLLVILIINARLRPPRPSHVSPLRALLTPFEFVLLPISGFLFSVLPGLDAHTRLMLGKYLEYRLTEKV